MTNSTESFLPGGGRLRELVDWVRLYLCYELDWDVRLQLQATEVPRIQLGARIVSDGRRGWAAGRRRRRLMICASMPRRTPLKEPGPHERYQPHRTVRQAQ